MMALDILALTPLLDNGGSNWLRFPIRRSCTPQTILYMCRARRRYRMEFDA